MKKIIYPIDVYQFLDIVEYWFEQESILPISGLSNLHYHKTYDLFDRKHDQTTIWHKCFYKMINSMKFSTIHYSM